MISTDCRKCAKSDICYADDVKPCIGYEPKKQTNADRIRSMSDEELAEFMEENAECDTYDCLAAKSCCTYSGRTCIAAWLDWLKQEVTE